jgi:hypothetical protein
MLCLIPALIPTKTSKQHPFIQTFLENIFAKFNHWNKSEKQKIML